MLDSYNFKVIFPERDILNAFDRKQLKYSRSVTLCCSLVIVNSRITNYSKDMKRRKLNRSERFGVWKAWEGACFWCREPVVFRSCEIDHVIPLDAVSSKEEEDRVKAHYGLNEHFNFDNFENFVPAHSYCNRSKSFSLPDPTPAFQLNLMQVRSKAGLSEAIAEKIINDAKKDNLLTMVEAAVRQGDLTEDDIAELFKGLPSIIRKAVDIPVTELFLTPGWKVHEQNGHLVGVVAENGQYGMTSTSSDPSWVCSNCGQKGPWNGIICLSCGNREAPD